MGHALDSKTLWQSNDIDFSLTACDVIVRVWHPASADMSENGRTQ